MTDRSLFHEMFTQPHEVVRRRDPLAAHDQACAVCLHRQAILDVLSGTFHPCGVCQKNGWRLEYRPRRRRWWRR